MTLMPLVVRHSTKAAIDEKQLAQRQIGQLAEMTDKEPGSKCVNIMQTPLVSNEAHGVPQKTLIR